MSGVFVRNNTGWNAAFKSWGGTLGRHMQKKTTEFVMEAKLEAPHPGGVPENRTRINYSTGEMVRKIYSTRGHSPSGDLESRVVVNVPYAKFVHEGTRPHEIRPARGGQLVFFWAKRGRPVWATQVMHPGTKPNQFLVRAARQVF